VENGKSSSTKRAHTPTSGRLKNPKRNLLGSKRAKGRKHHKEKESGDGKGVLGEMEKKGIVRITPSTLAPLENKQTKNGQRRVRRKSQQKGGEMEGKKKGRRKPRDTSLVLLVLPKADSNQNVSKKKRQRKELGKTDLLLRPHKKESKKNEEEVTTQGQRIDTGP